MTGQGLGAAASWVTVILFMEIARRAMKPMSKQNLVVLLHAASFMMMGNLLFPGGPMGELVYRAYQDLLHFQLQLWRIRTRDPQACFKAFLSNHWIGLFLFAGIAAMLVSATVGAESTYDEIVAKLRWTYEVEGDRLPLRIWWDEV